jgi:GTP cyclohydrolase I
VDEKKFISAKANVRVVLDLLGIPIGPNFDGTPSRWVKYLEAYTQEYRPHDDLGTTFPLKGSSEDIYDRAMIVQVGIPYRAVCAHHLLPVLGTAHVGYIPKDRVVGLSKLTRLVYGVSHQMPSLQEDVCHAITAHLMCHLGPIGAMCVISAEHGCMAARGVEEATGQVQTVTSSIKGVFVEKIDAREEFYRLVSLGKRS